MVHYLALSWAVSRGADTYGYNICRLDSDAFGSKRIKCMGGGYDMVGTVFGDWLEVTYPDRLLTLAIKARENEPPSVGGRYVKVPGFYGTTYDREGGKVSLDGACGIESMRSIARVIGLEVQGTYDRKGRCTGFIVTDSFEA